MKEDHIIMGHGSGGKIAAGLISEVFIKAFGQENSFLTDSAIIDHDGSSLAFTTDSYVVEPVFFPGGNIGKLAVCGTVNDLAVSGALPLALSAGFIIEEGFSINDLQEIVHTMASEAKTAGVNIVCGDTKVVPKGKCDRIFINTSGIGSLPNAHKHISRAEKCIEGDKILINGYIGDHATAIMAARNGIRLDPVIESDCASLNQLIRETLKVEDAVRFMRDATRGGLATVLSELAAGKNTGINLIEECIPVHPQVAGFCEMFGYDPLHMANEGKVVMVIKSETADTILETLRKHPLGTHCQIIGSLTSQHPGQVIMETSIGGKRIIDQLSGEQLPRIC